VHGAFFAEPDAIDAAAHGDLNRAALE